MLENAFEGAATGRSMKATITIADRSFSFPFIVFVPNKRTQAVPAVVHINNRYFEVMALIAPRGVYVASANEDRWADPRGEYASLVAAAPVFRLLGQESISNQQMPVLNRPRVVGRTGYHIRTGGHGLGDPGWKWFLDFADRLLKP